MSIGWGRFEDYSNLLVDTKTAMLMLGHEQILELNAPLIYCAVCVA